MGKEKETITNVKATLSTSKYAELVAGSKAWKAFDKSAMALRSNLYTVGKGLNVIYIDLKNKGVKRDEIVKIIDKYFPDMTKQEKSDYRKIASQLPDIETWAKGYYPKGFNPSAMLLHYARYQKEVIRLDHLFTKPNYHCDLEGNVKNLAYDNEAEIFFFPNLTLPTGKKSKVTDKGLEVIEQTLKHDIEASNPSKVTVKDFKGITDKFFNNATNLFNADKFTSDDDVKVLVHIHKRMNEFIELTYQTVKMEKSRLKKVA